MKILIAEDEPDMQKIIRLYLEKAGFETETASSGKEALDKLLKGRYDLLVADWMMPNGNGIQLCREIRSLHIPVKIILLTAKSEAENEITGLSCGADDYIRKPFEPKILILRIRKILQVEDALSCGALTLDPQTQTASLHNQELRLTQKEWLLLQIFMQNQGILLSRDQLLDRVWGADYEGDERTLDTHIRRLRGKIGKDFISTHVGMGYRMDKPHE